MMEPVRLAATLPNEPGRWQLGGQRANCRRVKLVMNTGCFTRRAFHWNSRARGGKGRMITDFAHTERRDVIAATHPECPEHQQLRLELNCERAKADRQEHAMRTALRLIGQNQPIAAMEMLTWGLIGP